MSNKTSRILLGQDYDLLSYQDKCKFADYSAVGSFWSNRKSGVVAKIIGRSWRGVHLSRDNGKITVIQNHYFASDYHPCV